MPQATSSPTLSRASKPGRPFFGMLEAVLVEEPVLFDFDGSISRTHAAAAWTWIVRDLAPDLIDLEAEDDPHALPALDALVPELLTRMRDAIAAAGRTREAARRLRAQLGSQEAHDRLPVLINALKCRHLIEKAQTFGRATNGMTEEAQLATALQSMPLNDQTVFSFLMHAALGQAAAPSKLTNAAIRIAGSADEMTLARAGFAPVFEAMLAHAQNQIRPVSQIGTFADIDLACRAVDRFHRLTRAVSGYLDLNRGSRWQLILAGLTKAVSDRIEPRLRDVLMDVNRALRRHRDGIDRLDGDQLLAALNGVYVLATVRDCRDSLALNALFDQSWMQVGQALEIHLRRNLEMFRANPADHIVGERLDAAIKMAELRFNAEYAEVLRRARDTISGGAAKPEA